jgi:hypothetical protein
MDASGAPAASGADSPSRRRSLAGTLCREILPPLLIAAVLTAIGAVSIHVQQPLLVPSLGSAICLQTMTPDAPSARAWNTGMGQLIGAAAGFAAVFLLSAAWTPHFMGNNPLTVPRVAAAVAAVIVTSVLQRILRATSAAGGATALIVALGAETATADGAARLAAGILLVTLLGEAARWLVLRTR